MCLIAIVAWFSPRFAIFLVWLFSDRMTVAFHSFWVGFIGFLFLPWTTLAWAFCYAAPRIPGAPATGVSGFGWFVVIFAFLVDLASYGSGARSRARRR
jgi:hypothetical protein